MSNKRRSHIKRAKVLRGRNVRFWPGSAVVARSRPYPPIKRGWGKITRKCCAIAQAMRGYYQD